VVIRSVRHRGLRALLEHDTPRYLRPDQVRRIRNVLTALILAKGMDDFMDAAPIGWRIHRLAGARRGQWSVAVSGNWRITFDEADGVVSALDLEDYH